MVFRVLVEVCLKIFSSSREIGILGERDDTWHTKDVSLRSCILLVFRQLFFLAALVVVYLLGHRHLFRSLSCCISRCLCDFEVVNTHTRTHVLCAFVFGDGVRETTKDFATTLCSSSSSSSSSSSRRVERCLSLSIVKDATKVHTLFAFE